MQCNLLKCKSFLMLGMVTFLGGGIQMMFLGQVRVLGLSCTWSGVVRRVWGQQTPRPPPSRRHWEDWRTETSCRNLTHLIRDRHSPATPFLVTQILSKDLNDFEIIEIILCKARFKIQP